MLKIKSKWAKRMLAFVLSGAMIVTSMTSSTLTANATEDADEGYSYEVVKETQEDGAETEDVSDKKDEEGNDVIAETTKETEVDDADEDNQAADNQDDSVDSPDSDVADQEETTETETTKEEITEEKNEKETDNGTKVTVSDILDIGALIADKTLTAKSYESTAGTDTLHQTVVGGAFTLISGGGKYTIATGSVSADGLNFKGMIKTEGAGSATKRVITFKATAGAKIVAYFQTGSGSNEARQLALAKTDGTNLSNGAKELTAENSAAGTPTKLEYTVPEGATSTYCLYGKSNVQIFYVSVTSEVETTDISSGATVTLSSTEKEYTGEDFKPTVTVKVNGVTNSLTEDKDFTVSYSRDKGFTEETTDFVSAGTIYVKVTGIGRYEGSPTDEISYTIKPIEIEKTTVEYGFEAGQTDEISVDLNKLFGIDASAEEYKGANCVTADQNVIDVSSVKIDGTSLKFTGDVKDGGTKPADIEITTAFKNYSGEKLTVTVKLIEKDELTIKVNQDLTREYNGNAVVFDATKVTFEKDGTALEDSSNITVDSVFSVKDGDTLAEAPTNPGEYVLTVSIPDTNLTYRGTVEVPFEIEKKTLELKAADRIYVKGYKTVPQTTALNSLHYNYDVLDKEIIDTEESKDAFQELIKNVDVKLTYTLNDTEITTADWNTEKVPVGSEVKVTPEMVLKKETTDTDALNRLDPYYEIKSVDGKVTVRAAEDALASGVHELNFTKNWTAGSTTWVYGEQATTATTGTDGYFSVTTEIKTAGTGNSVPLIVYDKYTDAAKVKSGKNVSFNTTKAGAKVEIIAAITLPASGKTNGIKVGDTTISISDAGAISPETGVTQLNGTVVYPTKSTPDCQMVKAEVTLGAAGTYTIDAVGNEFQLHYVKVTEAGSTEGSQPSTEGSQPTTEGSKPSTEGSQPTTEGSKPSTEGSQPTTEGSKPTTEGSQPTTEGSKPSTEGSQPTTEGSKPSTEGSQPTTEGSQPSTEGPDEEPEVEESKIKADSDAKDDIILVSDKTKIFVTAVDLVASKKPQYKVTVTYKNKEGKLQELTENVHFNVNFANGSDGIATDKEQKLTIEGSGKPTDLGTFKGKTTTTYKLYTKADAAKDKDISKLVKGAKVKSEEYTGTYITPGVDFKPGTTLTEDTHYTLVYKNNVNVGKASVTVIGKAPYYGSKTVNFSITARNIGKGATTTLSATNFTGDNNFKSDEKGNYTAKATYKGNEIRFNNFKLTANGITLKPGIDYTIAYKNNAKVGKATATIKAMNNFKGSIKVTYDINPVDVKATDIKNVTAKAELTTKDPVVSEITVNGVTLKAGTDFTADNKAIKDKTTVGATGTVTITGKGAYKALGKVEGVAVKVDKGEFRIKAGTTTADILKVTDIKKKISAAKIVDASGKAVTDAEVSAINVSANNKTIEVVSKSDKFNTASALTLHVATPLKKAVKAAKIDKKKVYEDFDGVNNITLSVDKLVDKYIQITDSSLTKDNAKKYIRIVSYKNNHKAGSATVTIEGKADSPYSGTVNISVPIVAVTKPVMDKNVTEGPETQESGESGGSTTPSEVSSQPASESSSEAASEPGGQTSKTLVFDMEKDVALGDIKAETKAGDFTLKATASAGQYFTAQNHDGGITFDDGSSFTKRLKTNGKATKDYRSIWFTAEKAGVLTIWARTSNNDLGDDRTVTVHNVSTDAQVGSMTIIAGPMSDVPVTPRSCAINAAGEYYIITNGGTNYYRVTFTPGATLPEDPGTESSSVESSKTESSSVESSSVESSSVESSSVESSSIESSSVESSSVESSSVESSSIESSSVESSSVESSSVESSSV